ncbi:hypothetical protein HK100_005966 [Physocladia obscura]|uniref:WSC domain-containing protein n=1 Tax=Physocladia obscura TaxID=109957 RepID=A0AAD5T6I9_9FUNG|nr:hypothetical protein HK100_005966 [Physocladia obscura]
MLHGGIRLALGILIATPHSVMGVSSGCYELVNAQTSVFTSSSISPATCSAACLNQLALIAPTPDDENVFYCACSVTALPASLFSKSCVLTCPGDSSSLCGGYDLNSGYIAWSVYGSLTVASTINPTTTTVVTTTAQAQSTTTTTATVQDSNPGQASTVTTIILSSSDSSGGSNLFVVTSSSSTDGAANALSPTSSPSSSSLSVASANASSTSGNAPVVISKNPSPTATSNSSSSTSAQFLSPAVIGGSVACALVVVIGFAVFVRQRQRSQNSNTKYHNSDGGNVINDVDPPTAGPVVVGSRDLNAAVAAPRTSTVDSRHSPTTIAPRASPAFVPRDSPSAISRASPSTVSHVSSTAAAPQADLTGGAPRASPVNAALPRAFQTSVGRDSPSSISRTSPTAAAALTDVNPPVLPTSDALHRASPTISRASRTGVSGDSPTSVSRASSSPTAPRASQGTASIVIPAILISDRTVANEAVITNIETEEKEVDDISVYVDMYADEVEEIPVRQSPTSRLSYYNRPPSSPLPSPPPPPLDEL